MTDPTKADAILATLEVSDADTVRAFEEAAQIADAFARGQQQMIDEEGPDVSCEESREVAKYVARAIRRRASHLKPEPVETQPEAPNEEKIVASAKMALMYLETGFVECERCGNEQPTIDLDATYELRSVLATDTQPVAGGGE